MRSPALPLRAAPLLLCLLLAAPSVRADERADELLRQVEQSTKGLSSLGADLQVTLITQNLNAQAAAPGQPRSLGSEPVSFTYTGTVKLQRPNLERVELADPIHQTIACDGESLWTLLQTKEYIKNPADPQGKSPSDYPPILMFFAPDTARMAGGIPAPANSGAENFATRYLGRERVVLKAAPNSQGGERGTPAEEFDVVEVRQFRPTPLAVKLYINADKIVTRVVSETRTGGISTIHDVSLIHLKPFQKFDPSEFVFQLPAGARPLVFKPAPPRK